MKKLFLRAFIGILTFSVSCVIGVSPIFAQTASSSPAPTVSMKPAVTPLDGEMKTLQENYKTQLSIYRTDQRAYELGKEQYLKLGTLTSLETAVKSTQKVMQSRTDVLMTYMKILSIMITQTPGIDVGEKEKLLKELTSVHDRLKLHQDVVKLAVDRIQLDRAVADFNSFSGQITQVTYKASAYRSYGKMQSVYDKTVTIRGEIIKHIEAEESNGLQLGEKRRALAEIDRQFQSASIQLNDVRVSFQSTQNRPASFSDSFLNRTIEDLGVVYGDIYRAISFFREVEQS